jgi:hypothetical protein
MEICFEEDQGSSWTVAQYGTGTPTIEKYFFMGSHTLPLK